MSQMVDYHFQVQGSVLRFTTNLELLTGEGKIFTQGFYTYKSARIYAKDQAPKKGCSEVEFVGEGENG